MTRNWTEGQPLRIKIRYALVSYPVRSRFQGWLSQWVVDTSHLTLSLTCDRMGGWNDCSSARWKGTVGGLRRFQNRTTGTEEAVLGNWTILFPLSMMTRMSPMLTKWQRVVAREECMVRRLALLVIRPDKTSRLRLDHSAWKS